MTLKTQKIWKKSDILTYFQKFSAKIFLFWSKKGWFSKILEKFEEKKMSVKTENLSRSGP